MDEITPDARARYQRKADEGEVIGLRRAAQDNLDAAKDAREDGWHDTADAYQALAQQFSMMAAQKAAALEMGE